MATGAAVTASMTASLTETIGWSFVPANSSLHPRSLLINRGWRYKAEDVAGAERPEFVDAGFTTVALPHINVELPWHSFDDKPYEFV